MTRAFASREFRFLWLAELLSAAGDQLARVALAVLVFSRTGSATAAAATYALTFLPALVGGVALAWVADRFRRRMVMVASDLLRAGLVAVMALPQLPFPLLCALLVLVVLLGAPHTAAQGALMPDVLGELYEDGLAIRHITNQTAQMVGFASGGVLVAALSPGAALLADALTFVVSAALARFGLADRPRPGGADGHERTGVRQLLGGLATIATDPRRRSLVALAWLVGCFIAPEALAAPYAAQLGAGPAAVGLLMAADPLGGVLGAWAFIRFVPAAVRERLLGPVAIAAGIPLLLMPLRPTVAVAMVLWGVSGMCATAYLLQTQASFVRATPDHLRGRAIGVAASGIVAGQGVAVLLAGLGADAWSPAVAIGLAGATGVVTTGVAALAWGRARRAAPEAPPVDSRPSGTVT